MTHITQSCSDLVHAQAILHRLALYETAFRRAPEKVEPGMRISVDFARITQEREVHRINAILACLPAANDMAEPLGVA